LILFRNETDFDGFGPSSWASAFELPTSSIPLHASQEAIRRSIREHCPATPGVYGMLGPDRELIYVGQSKSLRNRLLSYFTGEPASAKVGRIVEAAGSLVWESARHEFTALLRELELIRRWQPRFNVRGHPARTRRAYLCVGRGPAAQAYLSIRPSVHTGWTFGPVPAGRQYRRSVRRLNDCFGLRDCRRRLRTRFSDQRELFSQGREARCLRGAVGTCLAPCATACSQAEYGDRVEAVVDFLAGRDPAVLDRVQKEMRLAADLRRFELAARLRDAHEDLTRLSTFLQRLREAHGYSFVYPVGGHGGRENWYLIQAGRIMAVERGPRRWKASPACVKALDAVFPRDRRSGPPTGLEDLDGVLLVARWFRTHPGELETVLSPEAARRRCG